MSNPSKQGDPIIPLPIRRPYEGKTFMGWQIWLDDALPDCEECGKDSVFSIEGEHNTVYACLDCGHSWSESL